MDHREQSIDVVWRKSSHSEAGSCVEVAHTAELVFVRDSKDRAGRVLRFPHLAWASFLADMRSSLFDGSHHP